MGCGGSKDGTTQQTQWEAPYTGPPVDYHFIHIEATVESETKLKFLGGAKVNTVVTESYMPDLTSVYAQGYRLLTFTSTPGTITTGGIGKQRSATTKMKFQAIFYLPEDSRSSQFQLRVEKSALYSRAFISGGVFAIKRDFQNTVNSSHIFQTIHNIAQSGGRLICIEPTGVSGMGADAGTSREADYDRGQMIKEGKTPEMSK
jgi:hypothetical protein